MKTSSDASTAESASSCTSRGRSTLSGVCRTIQALTNTTTTDTKQPSAAACLPPFIAMRWPKVGVVKVDVGGGMEGVGGVWLSVWLTRCPRRWPRATRTGSYPWSIHSSIVVIREHPHRHHSTAATGQPVSQPATSQPASESSLTEGVVRGLTHSQNPAMPTAWQANRASALAPGALPPPPSTSTAASRAV